MSACKFKKEGILCILIFVLFLSFCQLYRTNEAAGLRKQEIAVMQTYQSVLPSSREVSAYIENQAEREKIEFSLAEYDALTKEAMNALAKEDYPVYTRSMTKICLLSALYRYQLYTHSGLSGVVSEAVMQREKEKMDAMFEELGMQQSAYSFLVKTDLYGNPESILQEFPGIVTRARMYEQYHEKGCSLLSADSYDGMSSLYHIAEKLLPVLLLVLSTLICMDMIYFDYKSGTLKLLLTQPKKRSFYLRRLCVQYFKRLVLLLIIPLTAVFLFTGAADRYAEVDAPMLAYSKGFTSFEGLDNQIEKTNLIYNEEKEIYFFHTRISPWNPGDMEPQPEMEILPFWKALLACTLYTAVLLMFYVILQLFFHVLLANPIAAAAAALFTAFAGIFLSPSQKATAVYNLVNPFTYRNPVYAVTGYIGPSYLWSLTIVATAGMLLFAAACLLFRKKDMGSM